MNLPVRGCVELRKPPPVVTGWRLFALRQPPLVFLYLWACSEPASLARVRMALAGTCAGRPSRPFDIKQSGHQHHSRECQHQHCAGKLVNLTDHPSSPRPSCVKAKSRTQFRLPGSAIALLSKSQPICGTISAGSLVFRVSGRLPHIATEGPWPGPPSAGAVSSKAGLPTSAEWIFLERTWQRRIIRRVDAQRHNSPKLTPALAPRWGFLRINEDGE